MIPIALRQVEPHRLTFAHRPTGGWIAAAVATTLYGGLLYLAGGWRDLVSSNAGLFATFTCGSVFAVGVFAGFWRHRFIVYRRHRRWVRERGLWPFVQRTEGMLDDSTEIVLERKERRHRDTGHSYSFPVTLRLGGTLPPVPLGQGTARVLGQRLMVEMARLLEVPAVDQTGSTPVKTPHQDLDMPPDPHAR